MECYTKYIGKEGNYMESVDSLFLCKYIETARMHMIPDSSSDISISWAAQLYNKPCMNLIPCPTDQYHVCYVCT